MKHRQWLEESFLNNFVYSNSITLMLLFSFKLELWSLSSFQLHILLYWIIQSLYPYLLFYFLNRQFLWAILNILIDSEVPLLSLLASFSYAWMLARFPKSTEKQNLAQWCNGNLAKSLERSSKMNFRDLILLLPRLSVKNGNGIGLMTSGYSPGLLKGQYQELLLLRKGNATLMKTA